LSGSATGGTAPYYFVWNTGDTTQYLNVNLTAPATFTCTVYDQNGCASNAQNANVTVRPPFVASVTTPVMACPGQAVTMTGSGVDGLPGYFYEWLTPVTHDTLANGSTYSYTPNGSETILMVARDECYRYDTIPVTVQIHALPSAEFVVTPASGCSPLTSTFGFPASTSGLITDAQWSFGDGSTGSGTNVSHQYTPVGCYNVSVQITTAEGCITDTTLVNVVCVVPDPIANFTWSPVPPTTVNSTVHFSDNSVNANTYAWDFGDYGTSTMENPVINYGDVNAGSYQVCLTVTSPEGCQNDICKPIVFIEEFLVYVPNTFTPDGDEFNNVFKPVVPDGMVLDDYTFTVVDRWGEILFESHDVEFGWDGTYHGVTVKEGVYTWLIIAKGGGDKKARRYEGHVNMLR
jgi:gliding motility-associated-like protein